MPEKGYLVIADITGYTAYLSQSELDHAEGILTDLLNALLENTKPPLVVSRLEGDAVISYAPEGSFKQGQTLVEIIESLYAGFRLTRERVRLNSTPTCQACINIPNLDLKFFVHFGTFKLQHVGTHTELVGPDVNLVHRLLKNTITEKTGLSAYAAYTQAAIDALDIADISAPMKSHTESYEHFGQVKMAVQDMHAVWEQTRHWHHVVVEPAEAVAIVEREYPLPAPIVWDYHTQPEYRTLIHGSDRQTLANLTAGRAGPGTIYHCAHGNSEILQTILDWQPFEYYTFERPSFLPGTSNTFTIRFAPTENGTRVTDLAGRTKGPLVGRALNDMFLRLVGRRVMRAGQAALVQRIEEELAAGKAVRPARVEMSEEQVQAAVAASLT
jgi:hypothetical protein